MAAHEVGSGKTLTSLAAKDQLGLPLDAITPAALVGNYEKEMDKHFDEVPKDVRIRSYEGASRRGTFNEDALAVLDEAHRARNSGTLFAQKMMPQVAAAKKRLLLTGTPVYNNPADLAPLINTVAGSNVLPAGPGFHEKYIGMEDVKAPLVEKLRARLLGYKLEDGKRKTLVNKKDLVDRMTGYVDVHRNTGEGFPSKIDETIKVPMSDKQMETYKFLSGDMSPRLRAKIESGLPLSKQESMDLNAFQGALRQASNTARPYHAAMNETEEWATSPKLQRVFEDIKKLRQENPNHRGVVYSNYLGAGLDPLSAALKREGISHNIFNGSLTEQARKRAVQEYNEGKTPLLLVSGAGAEGLDLKGTRSIQLMEPHWNNSRLNQVIGRGVRYKSHDHLPEAERNVRVMRYLSTLKPGLGGKLLNMLKSKPSQSIEEYLTDMSADKDRVTNQIGEAMDEASARGPLKKKAEHAVFGAFGLQKLSEEDRTKVRRRAKGHISSYADVMNQVAPGVTGGLSAAAAWELLRNHSLGTRVLGSAGAGAMGYLTSREMHRLLTRPSDR